MHLLPWSFRADLLGGLTLRGWHTPPSGRPVLHFLHGNGLCGRAYGPLLARLADDFDLWLCDVQGHGDSEAGGAFQGWNRNAAAALAAFEAHRGRFGDVPVHGVGHSLGGVLTALAAGTRGQPFASLVLLDPVLFPPPMLATLVAAGWLGLARLNPLAKGAARRRAHWPDRATAHAALQGRGAYKGWTEDALAAFIAHGLRDADDGVALKCPPRLEAEVFSSGPRRLWRSVRALPVPTLVLHGERSFPFVARAARLAQRVNGRVQARQVPGGHCFMQEAPEDAAAHVRRFLLDGR